MALTVMQAAAKAEVKRLAAKYNARPMDDLEAVEEALEFVEVITGVQDNTPEAADRRLREKVASLRDKQDLSYRRFQSFVTPVDLAGIRAQRLHLRQEGKLAVDRELDFMENKLPLLIDAGIGIGVMAAGGASTPAITAAIGPLAAQLAEAVTAYATQQ